MFAGCTRLTVTFDICSHVFTPEVVFQVHQCLCWSQVSEQRVHLFDQMLPQITSLYRDPWNTQSGSILRLELNIAVCYLEIAVTLWRFQYQLEEVILDMLTLNLAHQVVIVQEGKEHVLMSFTVS